MFDQVLIYLRFEAPGVILRRCENVFIAWGKKALQILAVQYIFDMKAGRIAASRGTQSRMGPAGGVGDGDGDGYGCWDKSRPLSAATSTTCRVFNILIYSVSHCGGVSTGMPQRKNIGLRTHAGVDV